MSSVCQLWAPRPGIPELVARLQARGADVFLVSGGFRAIIDPIAELLGIPLDHVHANTILFKMGCMAPHSLHACTLRRFLRFPLHCSLMQPSCLIPILPRPNVLPSRVYQASIHAQCI